MVGTLDWELESSNFFSSLAFTLFHGANLFLVLVPKMASKDHRIKFITWTSSSMWPYCELLQKEGLWAPHHELQGIVRFWRLHFQRDQHRHSNFRMFKGNRAAFIAVPGQEDVWDTYIFKAQGSNLSLKLYFKVQKNLPWTLCVSIMWFANVLNLYALSFLLFYFLKIFQIALLISNLFPLCQIKYFLWVMETCFMARQWFVLANTLLLKRMCSLVLLEVFHKYLFTHLCSGC